MPDPKKNRANPEDVIIGVYTGRYKPTQLPEGVYKVTAEKLNAGVKKGLESKIKLQFKFDQRDAKLTSELQENIYMFSAAKTFNQTLEMSDALIDENGNRRILKDFKIEATKIYEKYNGPDLDGNEMGGWLKTEYDTAIGQARMADKWNEIEKNKKDFPVLMYKTSEGEEVCDICEPLDGIILPADDSFWDENYPENHFHCNCVVIQMDEDTATDYGGVDDSEEVKGWVDQSQEKKNPMFNMNSGKDRVIFKDSGSAKHGYFDVPKEYQDFAKRNFDLPIPKN